MSKILVFLAVLIFSGVMASECANAGNHVERDFRYVGGNNYTILEMDFTHGESAIVSIDVVSIIELVHVYFMPQESLAGILSGGSWYYYSDYSARYTQDWDKNFTMNASEWWHNTYYYVVMPATSGTTYIDVDFHVEVDYDGDGLYGSKDTNPLVNGGWLASLNQEFSNLSSDMEYLRDDLLSHIDYLRNDLKNNVTVLQEDIVGLQSFLLTQVDALTQICDSLSETMMSLNMSLVELEFATGMEFDVLQESVVNIYNNFHILQEEFGVQIDDVNSEVADIWDWNNESLNHTMTELTALDNREWANNAANVQDNQLARLTLREAQEDIKKAQEDIEDALDEAKAARTVGLVTGLVGILLAIVAIVLIISSKMKASRQ